MKNFTWLNPYLPQTLQISIVIAYFRAVLDILFSFGRLSIFGWLLAAAMVGGAFGIANLRYWGYFLALAVAVLPFVAGILFSFVLDYTILEYIRSLVTGPNLVSTVIQVAIVILLVHPMSRSFVKNNFVKTIP